MKINIKKTGVDLSSDQQQVYLAKLEGFTRLLAGDSEETVVDLELGRITKHHKRGDVYFVKIKLSAPGREHYAETSSHTIDVALEETKEKLIREIRRHKEKELSSRRKFGRIRRALKGFWFKKD